MPDSAFETIVSDLQKCIRELQDGQMACARRLWKLEGHKTPPAPVTIPTPYKDRNGTPFGNGDWVMVVDSNISDPGFVEPADENEVGVVFKCHMAYYRQDQVVLWKRKETD